MCLCIYVQMHMRHIHTSDLNWQEPVHIVETPLKSITLTCYIGTKSPLIKCRARKISTRNWSSFLNFFRKKISVSLSWLSFSNDQGYYRGITGWSGWGLRWECGWVQARGGLGDLLWVRGGPSGWRWAGSGVGEGSPFPWNAQGCSSHFHTVGSSIFWNVNQIMSLPGLKTWRPGADERSTGQRFSKFPV